MVKQGCVGCIAKEKYQVQSLIYKCTLDKIRKPIHYASTFTMPVQSLCQYNHYASTITMPVQSLCQYNHYASTITMPVQSLCQYNHYASTITMPVQSLCQYNRASSHLKVQSLAFISIVHLKFRKHYVKVSFLHVFYV